MFHQITLVGYVGNDAEMRYTKDGMPVANFNVAVNNRWTNAAGASIEETVWFRITTWRRQAEIVSEYVHKGQLVLVVGELKLPHTWVDQEGQAQATLEVTARAVKFLPGNPRAGEPQDVIAADDDSVAAE